ncbi:2Fe-2S ferredoxin [Nostoc sp. CENA543]|uniref:(2Fe-2S) ferredoxin domain-containing protein n=1 Tax=Nostoc sp. CENA543 TaxID=1869241 RepID=UPI000CA27E8D|nr:(2Fe-2S) ferredoxin domain-containing protein [Nostoc sp. CENA543]AUS99743.1 2Fe-2S ferredoxin [Nostoc sp. CENA543]
MSNFTQELNASTTNPSFLPRCVRVCQHRTCKKQGAKETLAAFVALPVPDVVVTPSSCLGQCGNGPMVLILPEMVWYSGVQPYEVPMLVEKHLIGGQRVQRMLYYRFHPQG